MYVLTSIGWFYRESNYTATNMYVLEVWNRNNVWSIAEKTVEKNCTWKWKKTKWHFGLKVQIKWVSSTYILQLHSL